VKRLHQTNAKLIWASTTPVPPQIDAPPPRRNADVLAYNAVAKKVMDEAGIPINDLYEQVLSKLKDLQLANDPHFKDEGSEFLAKQVATAIEKALKR